MALLGEPLFTERNNQTLDDFLKFKAGTIEETVEHIAELRFKNETEDDVALTVVSAFTVRLLELKLASAVVTVNETSIDAVARHDYKTERTGAKTFGYHMAKAIPYSGAPELWKFKPEGDIPILPRGIVSSQSLTVGTVVPEDAVEEGKKEVQELLELIQGILDRQAVQIERYNAALPGIIKPMVKIRRQRYRRLAEIRESF
jgi:hypothetical protein